MVILFELGGGERGRFSGWDVVRGMGGLGTWSSSPCFREPRRGRAGGGVLVDCPEGAVVIPVS